MNGRCDLQAYLSPQADGHYQLKLEVVIHAAPCEVAVVLDMSDSAKELREAARQLQVLLRRLPRSCKLWIYRLSSEQRLNDSQLNSIACVQDGRLNFLRWLDDRRLVETARLTGSILGPAIRAIDGAREPTAARHLVLVLTDGQVHDLASVQHSKTLSIIGILPTSDDKVHIEHWQRVCPDAPLVMISDPSLDALIEKELGADDAYTCRIAPCDTVLEMALKFGDFQAQTRSGADGVATLPQGKSEITITTPDRPPLETTISISSSNGHELGSWRLSDFETVVQHMDRPGTPDHCTVQGELVFDSARDRSSQHVTEICSALRSAAEVRARWSTQIVLNVLATELTPAHTISLNDFLIAFCATGKTPERLIIAVVRHGVSPSIQWPPGASTALGVIRSAIKVEYHSLERRWYLLGETEIDPRACQDLGVIESDTGDWQIFSSGPLA